MYVGEFFLTKPFDDYEKTQIRLVKNLDWFDVSKLENFTDEVKDILSKNKLISEERIDKIIYQINLRIEYILELKKSLEN